MRQLSSTDMLMLMLDSPRTPNHMGPVLICEPARASGHPVTFEEICSAVQDRLPQAPVLRQRLISTPLGLDNPSTTPTSTSNTMSARSAYRNRVGGNSFATKFPNLRRVRWI